jgi:hypothetical protein
MWFFPVRLSFLSLLYGFAHLHTQRTSMPGDLAVETPDPSKWPTPDASFPASGCDPRAFFNPQKLIMNIDICGARTLFSAAARAGR